MPRYIIKLEHESTAYYLEWSSIVDAPVTYGMPLEEFKEYYWDEYGRKGMEELDGRLSRVEAKGTSSHIHRDLDAHLCVNRAGEDEAELTKQEIIQRYCVDRPERVDLITSTLTTRRK